MKVQTRQVASPLTKQTDPGERLPEQTSGPLGTARMKKTVRPARSALRKKRDQSYDYAAANATDTQR